MTTASASTRTSPSGSWGEQGTGTVPPAAGSCGFGLSSCGWDALEMFPPPGTFLDDAEDAWCFSPGTCSCPLLCKSRHHGVPARCPAAEHHPSTRYKGLRE